MILLPEWSVDAPRLLKRSLPRLVVVVLVLVVVVWDAA